MAQRMRHLKITKQITNRESPSFDKYLQEIGQIRLVTAQEEVELARRIKQGDEVAFTTLYKANLRFVVSVAKQYQGHGVSLPDLVNEGNIGLGKAVGRFDETRGFKFISYAVWWIRQQIMQSLAEHARVVRLPLNKIASLKKINEAFAKFEQEHEYPPNEHKLAEILGITLDEVKVGLNNTGYHVSLDAPVRDDIETNTKTLLDKMSDEDQVDAVRGLMKGELAKEIERVLKTFEERHAQVIRLYFGLNGNQPHTLEEIGQKLDLTSERVRQMKERVIRRIRHHWRTGNRLRPFVGI